MSKAIPSVADNFSSNPPLPGTWWQTGTNTNVSCQRCLVYSDIPILIICAHTVHRLHTLKLQKTKLYLEEEICSSLSIGFNDLFFSTVQLIISCSNASNFSWQLFKIGTESRALWYHSNFLHTWNLWSHFFWQ